MEEKEVLVGLDLTDEFTQLSYYTMAGELYSVSLSGDPLKYRIPTTLRAYSDGRDWLFGDEAVNEEDTPESVRIDGLLSLACMNGQKEIFGQNYEADILLERFFRRLFNALKEKISATSIRGVVVTVKEYNEKLKQNLISSLELLGIRGDSFRMITHLESFMYYVVSQNKDIWINDVGMFDFDKEGCTFYRLSFGRRSLPVTIVADKTDLSGKISYAMLEPDESDRLIYNFDNSASSMLHKQIVSALYCTGAGFETNWADEILKKLSNGRRIFRGQNLYVKGAGYAANLMFNSGVEDYLLVSDNVLKSSISIRAYHEGSYDEIELASIGQPYSEAGCSLEVIMDKTNELDFIVHNVLKKDFICAIMTLDTLELRNDRTVRLNIRLRFPERNVCVITVRDIGFGEIYKTNHKIWEQVLKI